MFFISVAIFAGVYLLHNVKVKYFLSDWPLILTFKNNACLFYMKIY